MKCIIMDYCNAVVRVIYMPPKTDSEKAELILTEKYDYKLSNINYMLVSDFVLEDDTA